jgi:AcrR family transcriptional regulator
LSRTADSTLSERILDAAHELARSEGVEAVSLRKVAVLAKTTTPTVYARFGTKEELLLALANRARLRFAGELMQQPTLQKAAHIYLQLVLDRPHDYRLIYDIGWPHIFSDEADQPGVIWARERFAELHGGKPKDYALVVECLWMELHGSASFLAKAPNSAVSKRLHKNCLRACAVIIANARLFSSET